MLSVGIDTVEIDRVARVYRHHGDRFLQRVYTPREGERYRHRVDELAAHFAGKEAVSKALGTGLHGVSWREIEIMPDRRGKPLVFLSGRAAARADELGLREFAISLTHTATLAMAFVVAT